MIEKISDGFLMIVIGILLLIGISRGLQTYDYLRSDKVETQAVIVEDGDGQLLYQFEAVPEGVRGTDLSGASVGENVTVYYQKNKPHMVYQETQAQVRWREALIPIGWALFFMLFLWFIRRGLPGLTKKISR